MKQKSNCTLDIGFFKKGDTYGVSAVQDAPQPAEKSRNGGKVCFYCTFLQGINKKMIDDY
jgi:hypothetical protein